MTEETKICHFLTLGGQEISCLSTDIVDIMSTLEQEFKKKDVKAIILALVKDDDKKIILQTK